MAVLQTWLQRVGQALGTRTISFVSLPAPVDERIPPTAPVSEAGTLDTLGEWVLNAGLPCLSWNIPLSLTDPEAKMPSGRHARPSLRTLFNSLSVSVTRPQSLKGWTASGLCVCAQGQHSICTEEMLGVPSVRLQVRAQQMRDRTGTCRRGEAAPANQETAGGWVERQKGISVTGPSLGHSGMAFASH